MTKHQNATSNCEYCGAPFHPYYKSIGSVQRFCSQECKAASQVNKVLVTCSYCGAPVKVSQQRARLGKHFYCNRTCRANHITGPNNPSYTSGKGRKPEYGGNWKRQRSAALERDNHTCQLCRKRIAKKWDCHVHHITPAYKFGTDHDAANQLQNLITLCHHCHIKVEHGKAVIQPKLL